MTSDEWKLVQSTSASAPTGISVTIVDHGPHSQVSTHWSVHFIVLNSTSLLILALGMVIYFALLHCCIVALSLPQHNLV